MGVVDYGVTVKAEEQDAQALAGQSFIETMLGCELI